MKLAIPYEEGQIFQHFGKTPAFKIYDIAKGQVGTGPAHLFRYTYKSRFFSVV